MRLVNSSGHLNMSISLSSAKKTVMNLQMIAAASLSFSIVTGLLTPLSLDQKAGKSTLPSLPSAKVAIPTPSVSKYSIVLGMSRKLLQPLLTTATGVRPSSVKSAEMSILDSAPLCTPPSPPVANTRIPARCASIIVPAIVVPPLKCFPANLIPQT